MLVDVYVIFMCLKVIELGKKRVDILEREEGQDNNF
jgi:hypothetical protein